MAIPIIAITKCMGYCEGVAHIFPMMPVRLKTSTAIQNTITVAVAIRMLAPQACSRSCFLKMKGAPIKAPTATANVRGWSLPIKIGS